MCVYIVRYVSLCVMESVKLLYKCMLHRTPLSHMLLKKELSIICLERILGK